LQRQMTSAINRNRNAWTSHGIGGVGSRGRTPGRASALGLAGFFFTILLACTSAATAFGGEGNDAKTSSQGTLRVQSTLVIEKGGEHRTLRQLEPGEEFQGYGFLSPTKVFVASSRRECGGACTYLEVIDVETGVENLLHILGATGGSEFEVSPDGSCVAFNWSRGIWVFSGSKVLADLAAGRFDERNFKERFRRIAEVDDPLWFLSWVDGRRLKYCVSKKDCGCSMKEVVVSCEEPTPDPPRAAQEGAAKAVP